MPDSRFEAFRLSLGMPDSPKQSTMEGLDQIPVCYASVSIGCRDEHTLPKKLDAIAAAGFQAIELGFPDLLSFANLSRRSGEQDAANASNSVGEKDWESLCTAAKEIKLMCDERGLKILILQPFSNFEGWAEGSEERKDAWERVDGWVKIMEACGTEMLQVGASDTPEEKIGKDRSRFVKDLRELADLLAKKNFRVAYENWCWSTHAPDWEDVWDICKQVDRSNFGLCLDTFQSAGGEWADPSTESGMIEDGRSKEQLEKDWKASCERLSKTIPKDKIFFLQISDAYKPKPGPLPQQDIDGLRPRGFWSHAYRPLPFEGYLPVVDFTKAVLKTGFRGWFSYEIFDSGPDGKGRDYEMGSFAKTAFKTQEKLLAECKKS